MERTTHTLQTKDGIAISLDAYRTGTHQAAVLLCPGFFQSKDTPTFQRMAHAISGDWDVLSMDFRGHGRSSGVYTFSARESADLAVVLAWIRRHYARVGIVGFSMGGAVTINTVAQHAEGIRSVIAVSAPCRFEDIDAKWWTPQALRTGLQGLEPGAGCRPGNVLLKKPRPLEHVPRVSPIPLLLVHGTRDAIVGLEHSRRLYAAAGQPKRLEIIEGGSHAEALFRDDPQRFSGLLREWFAQTLVHHQEDGSTRSR